MCTLSVLRVERHTAFLIQMIFDHVARNVLIIITIIIIE